MDHRGVELGRTHPAHPGGRRQWRNIGRRLNRRLRSEPAGHSICRYWTASSLACFGGHWDLIDGARRPDWSAELPEIDNSMRATKRHKKHKNYFTLLSA